MSISTIYRLTDRVRRGIEVKLPTKVDKATNLIEGNLIPKISKQIPNVQSIKDRICNNPDIEGAKKAYNDYNNLLTRLNYLNSQSGITISKLEDSLSLNKSLLETLSTVAETLNVIITALKLVIPVLTSLLASQSAGIANGLTIDTLSNRKKDIKDKIKLFSAVIKGVLGIIKFILPKISNLESKIEGLRQQYDNISDVLSQVGDSLNNCLKERLAKNTTDLNLSLSTLIDRENNNQGIQVEEFIFDDKNVAISYKVKNVLPEDLEN